MDYIIEIRYVDTAKYPIEADNREEAIKKGIEKLKSEGNSREIVGYYCLEAWKEVKV